MALKASEISTLIKERIENFEASAEARDVGTVIAVTDGIVRIHGLADARYGEMLEFPQNTFGMALNLEQDSVGAVVLGDYKHISEGDTVKTTGRILEVPIGEALLGRVVDSLGNPIDGKALTSFPSDRQIVLHASHDHALMMRTCPKAILIDGGTIRHYGTTEEVLDLYHRMSGNE